MSGAAETPEIKYLFIRRPILRSLSIVGCAVFSRRTLPINRLSPITRLSTSPAGIRAPPLGVESGCGAIEQQLSGLDGLLYFKSSNASDGTMSLQVYFDLSRNLDLAAVDVQNQVSLAEPQLPQEVVRQGITITKAQTDILAVIALSSKDPQYDAAYLNNYARIYIIDELKRIPGVGDASGIGSLYFSMLLSLDPDRMAQLGLTVSDVQAAVQEQNTTNPAGRIGREPAPAGNQLTIPVTALGRLTDTSVRRHHRARQLRRLVGPGQGHRQGDAGIPELRPGLPGDGFHRRHPDVSRPGSNALNGGGSLSTDERAGPELSGRVTWYMPFDTTPFIPLRR